MKLGQGNIFTSVCLSTRGGGVTASVHGGIYPLGADTPPGADPPGSRHHQPPNPPGKQTPAYGQRAAGTHPTGMHSCSTFFPLCHRPNFPLLYLKT